MVKNLLVLSLLLLAPIIFANTPISECGNYSKTDYYDLTEDISSTIGTQCLSFTGNVDVALNCHGHSIDSNSIGVSGIGLKTISIQNCFINGVNAVKIEHKTNDTTVWLYNNELTGSSNALIGTNWNSQQFNLMKVNGRMKLTNIKTLTALDSDYDESMVSLSNGRKYSIIQRFFKVNLSFVDSVSQNPLSVAILLNSTFAGASQYSTDVNGNWWNWIQVSRRTPTLFQDYNPYDVQFISMCHRKIHNPTYFLTAPINAIVEMVNNC